jgi:hypothetical protein
MIIPPRDIWDVISWAIDMLGLAALGLLVALLAWTGFFIWSLQ